VYATFYFIEERFPDDMPISSFKLDETLRFGVFLRAFKNIAVEGKIVFDRVARVAPLLDACGGQWPGDTAVAPHPSIRFGNIFITPQAGNSALRVAPPANADFSALPFLPNEENPYHLTKPAQDTGDLGLLEAAEWEPIFDAFETGHPIDVDRDTNGARLVYFANYVAFMDAAERQAMAAHAPGHFSAAQVMGRTLVRRRVAYYGNAPIDDVIRTRVSLFGHRSDAGRIGVRYAIRRETDDRLICRSEAIKLLPRGGASCG
jgi:probable biosynthetic protein (TIGR04098 family)